MNSLDIDSLATPEGWVWVLLKDIATLINGDRGRNYPSSKHYVSSGIPFITAANISSSELDLRSLNYITEEKFNSLNSGKLIKDDIIYCLRGTLGKIAFFKNLVKGAIASSLVIIRLNECVNKKYIYYYLSSPFGKTLIKIHDNGTAQPNLSAASVKNYNIPIPPLPEQRAIVAKIEQLFSDLDNGIANLKAAQAKLDIYRQAVLKQAFEGELTREWREKQTDLPSGEKILEAINGIQLFEKYSFLSIIDEDSLSFLSPHLKYIKLGACISSIQAGKSFKCDERPPSIEETGVAKVSAVSWSEYQEKESKTCLDESKVNPDYFISEGDFLFSRANTIELVGTCVIVKKTNFRIMLSDKILRINFSWGVKEFFLYYLRSKQGRREIEKRSTGNQESMRNIGQEKIKNIIVPLFSIIEQIQIVQEIESRLSVCDKLADTIQTSLQQAEALRQSILKKAFEGRLLTETELQACKAQADWMPADQLLAQIKSTKSK